MYLHRNSPRICVKKCKKSLSVKKSIAYIFEQLDGPNVFGPKFLPSENFCTIEMSQQSVSLFENGLSCPQRERVVKRQQLNEAVTNLVS